jgi:glycosyltransferase involved in cell wall biosynthesis
VRIGEEHPAPRVTVVLATYNWATVLPYSIGSVLDQTFTDFELLVIGDCCSDESEQVVASFSDPRVRWINLPEKTRHQVGPNNEGIRQARGTIVAYIGHDDLWLPRHLELVVAAIERGATFAHGRVLHVVPDETPRVIPRRGWSYRRGARIPPTSLAHRLDAARAVGGWRLPVETGSLDPESDLCARLFDRYGRPALVSLVTSVKLPASRRPGVYRDRPHHEQDTWRDRIHATSAPEQTFLDAYGPRPLYPTRIVWILGKAATQLRHRALVAFRRAPAPAELQHVALARNRRNRKLKGLED